mmetsp:Transcript_16673/g.42641  ORF Transcript_16673/g.42641 Transcript_16673/m.42641 type:complete len:574 (+) Transcript_16673:163-1884(+)|eukprot:CAMPEP_0177648458 /NCGR_PEP_ID=MMETSP0447-20121125/10839_1 /TAXON_ID=0 /ORGANISM="Stygamoeba regulata, Strain BSH-02190019" /LENGTH=573 /DNA_ID=CAMNT_0019151101 /DNA_START=147 /DNA_END=1868 /DNA_ORIENTATION=+
MSAREVEAARLIQRQWTAFVMRKLFSKLVRSIRHRNQIAQEILTTERSFVRTLHVIVDCYKRPLIEEEILPRKHIDAIFSNIEDILSINEDILKALELRLADWNAQSCLGDVFLRLVPILKQYQTYCSNYRSAITLIEQKRDTSSKFDLWLKNKFTELNLGLPLTSLLIQPIQRIPRYKLLFEELYKNTYEDHKDRTLLEDTLERIKHVADYVNESVREHQSMEKLIELKKKFTGNVPPLLAPKRFFIRDGTLTKVCRKTLKKRVFFLFSDILIYGIRLETTTAVGIEYKFHRLIHLNNASVVDVPDKPSMSNAFQLLSSTKSFTLIADNPGDKRGWMNCLEQCIHNLGRKTIDQRYSVFVGKDLENPTTGAPAPIWVPDREHDRCMLCTMKFTTIKRRHHCRRCGVLVCGGCSARKFRLENLNKTCRVCDKCFVDLAGVSEESPAARDKKAKAKLKFPFRSAKDLGALVSGSGGLSTGSLSTSTPAYSTSSAQSLAAPGGQSSSSSPAPPARRNHPPTDPDSRRDSTPARTPPPLPSVPAPPLDDEDIWSSEDEDEDALPPSRPPPRPPAEF